MFQRILPVTLFFIFILVGCSKKQEAIPIIYRSTDESTGGFQDISLELDPEGFCSLTIDSSISEGESVYTDSMLYYFKGKWNNADSTFVLSFDTTFFVVARYFQNENIIFHTEKSKLNGYIEFKETIDTLRIKNSICIRNKTL